MNELALATAGPEIFLLSAACILLLVATFKVPAYLLQYATIAVLLLTFIMVGDGGNRAVLSYYGLYETSALAAILQQGILLTSAGVLAYSGKYLSERAMLTGEYMVLALFAVAGMLFLVASPHFLTLYLGLELMSLSLYAMIALRRDDARAIEAAMKYFVLGAIASGLLLYGISMIYAATGELGFKEVAQVAAREIEGAPTGALVLGLVFLVAGVAFKLGAAPFHMWLPDVYDGAPTAVTAFIGSVPKIAAFALVIRVVTEAGDPLVKDWSGMLAILAVASLAVGNITAIAQKSLKRMLAYSAISHMGFLLIGLSVGTQTGYAAGLFYALTYALMSVGGFGMLTLLAHGGHDTDLLSDVKGLAKRNGFAAALIMVLMLSMAGIPPLVGFYAKLAVWNAAVDAGWVWLAAIAALFSVIGAFYYLRVIKLMYFDEPSGMEYRVVITKPYMLLATVNILLVVGLGIMPASLMNACLNAFGL